MPEALNSYLGIGLLHNYRPNTYLVTSENIMSKAGGFLGQAGFKRIMAKCPKINCCEYQLNVHPIVVKVISYVEYIFFAQLTCSTISNLNILWR